MANFIYNDIRNALGSGALGVTGWATAGKIFAQLMRTTGSGGGPYYTSPAVTDVWATLPTNSNAVPVTAITLGSLTVGSAGQLNAANAVFTAVPSGDVIQACVVFYFDGTSTHKLVAYIDTSTTGPPALPVTPNGGEIDVDFASGTVCQI